jgi:hypothetical protein
MQACFDPGGNEAKQLLVDGAALLDGLLRVGVCADAPGDDGLVDAGGKHGNLLGCGGKRIENCRALFRKIAARVAVD